MPAGKKFDDLKHGPAGPHHFEIILPILRRHVGRENLRVGAADQFLLRGAATAFNEMPVAKHDLALGILAKKERAGQMLEELPQTIRADVAQPLEVPGVGHGYYG
jgi:hypothetical protein